MSDTYFDFSTLDQFSAQLLRASKAGEELQKKFLRQEGSKLARRVRAVANLRVAQTAVQKKAYTRAPGRYHKGIKRGKVWKKEGEGWQVRAYSGDPVAHLLEEGHKQLVNPGKGRGNGRGVKPGKGIGHAPKHGKDFVEGRYVFRDAAAAFASQFFSDSEQVAERIFQEIK